MFDDPGGYDLVINGKKTTMEGHNLVFEDSGLVFTNKGGHRKMTKNDLFSAANSPDARAVKYFLSERRFFTVKEAEKKQKR